MQITQKCQYALRAVYELARRDGEGPVKIADIADVQGIPPRFLEVILSQLKQAAFVISHRGSEGGYQLARSAEELTVGEVMRFMQGPLGPVECVSKRPQGNCSLYGICAFLPMWEKALEAMSDVYDNTTFRDLLEQGSQLAGEYKPSYCI